MGKMLHVFVIVCICFFFCNRRQTPPQDAMGSVGGICIFLMQKQLDAKLDLLIDFANKHLRQPDAPVGFVFNHPHPLVVSAQEPINAFARAIRSVEPVIVENEHAAHSEFAKRQHGVFQHELRVVVSVNVNQVEEVVLQLWNFLIREPAHRNHFVGQAEVRHIASKSVVHLFLLAHEVRVTLVIYPRVHTVEATVRVFGVEARDRERIDAGVYADFQVIDRPVLRPDHVHPEIRSHETTTFDFGHFFMEGGNLFFCARNYG